MMKAVNIITTMIIAFFAVSAAHAQENAIGSFWGGDKEAKEEKKADDDKGSVWGSGKKDEGSVWGKKDEEKGSVWGSGKEEEKKEDKKNEDKGNVWGAGGSKNE